MKIVLVGSSTFPVVQYARAIAEYVRAFPKDTVFLTRASEGFDRFAGECARIMGYKVEEFPGKGGAFNFERDVAIVKGAERVVAFFDPEVIGQGGTQHVIDKALDQRKPVEAYTAQGGRLVLCGSDDGEGHRSGGPAEARWQAQAPRERPPEPTGPSRGSASEGQGIGPERGEGHAEPDQASGPSDGPAEEHDPLYKIVF